MKILNQLLLLISFFAIVSCGNSHEYHKVVEQELASGERHDSIFLGFYLGMPNKDFFDSCTILNRKRLIYQGGRGVTVNFNMDLLRKKVEVEFFPNFYQNKIYEMEVSYRYFGWSPWRKDMYAEKLMYRLLAIYEKTYGEGFIEIKSPQNKMAYVKVDGNRRISIYGLDEQVVRVIFTDLLVEEAAEKSKPKLADKDKNKPIWWNTQKK